MSHSTTLRWVGKDFLRALFTVSAADRLSILKVPGTTFGVEGLVQGHFPGVTAIKRRRRPKGAAQQLGWIGWDWDRECHKSV
jgi:hypothetical protein